MIKRSPEVEESMLLRRSSLPMSSLFTVASSAASPHTLSSASRALFPSLVCGLLATLFLLGALPMAGNAQSESRNRNTSNRATFSPAEFSPQVTFAGVALRSPAGRAPYRDSDDWVLCAAPELLAPLGITSAHDAERGTVTLTGPDGRATVTLQARTPRRNTSGRGIFVPIVEAVEGLGGKCQFDQTTNALAIRSVISQVEMLGGQLRVRATLPILPRVRRFAQTRQVVVDVPGAEVGDLPRELDVVSPLIRQARSGQFNDDTVRIALDMKSDSGTFRLLERKPNIVVVLNPSYEQAATPTPAENEPVRPTDSAVNMNLGGPDRGSLPSRGGGIVARAGSSADLRAIGNGAVRLSVRTSGGKATDRPSIRVGRGGRLFLDAPGAFLNEAALRDASHPLLRGVQVTPTSGGARIVLDVSRVVTYLLKPVRGGFVLELAVPRSASGTLAGKTVVVDPGHGGSDSGARGVNGTYEKNVNLKIGAALAALLSEAGANVVMTRTNDSFPSLDDRCHIANRAGADFFIAVHADSSDRSRVVNGSTVYYHKDVSSCRALAQSIADRFAAMGGIRTKGVRSDRVVAPSKGFAVLRGTRMVGVLVECGYMTSPNDVALLNRPAMQRKIAASITAGLRDYISGNPYGDSRAAQPRYNEDEAAEEDAPDAEMDADSGSGAGTPPIPPSDGGGDERFFPDRR